MLINRFAYQQEISLHGCGVTDSDMNMMLAVLTMHKRIKSIKISGKYIGTAERSNITPYRSQGTEMWSEDSSAQ